MAALTDNKLVEEKDGKIVQMIVKASTTVYRNALVMIEAATGHIKPCAAEASAIFAGVAYEDNKDGASVIRVIREGVFPMVAAGMAQTDLGKAVYASDDQTVSTTQGANELEVGKIVEVVSATKVMVDIKRY